jgi:hypothetical protein
MFSIAIRIRDSDAREGRELTTTPQEALREIEGLLQRFARNSGKEETMFRRKLLFTSLALLVVLGSAPALRASSRSRPVEPSPLDAPFAGMRLDSEIQLSPDGEGDRYRPAVAYNYLHGEYLVVWHNTWPGGGRDIYGRRVSRTGELLSWFCIATGLAPGGDGKSRSQPAVAYNAATDQYLVVWMYEADPTNKPDVHEIWGKIIPWNGPGSNAEFQIISWTNRSFWTPRVAWNSWRNEYLVIWNAFNTTTSFPPGVPNDIAGYRISASGSVYNPGSPLSITTADYPQQADLAYNVAMDEYLVVWVRVYSAATTGNDIYGARVGWNGVVVAPPGQFVIEATGVNENSPAVATNQQHRYLVAWEYEYGVGDHDIKATHLDALGNLLPHDWLVAITFDDETNPDVAAAPGAKEDYFFVWQRSTAAGEAIWGWRWTPTINTGYFEIASVAFWDCESPAVAIDVPGYLIAYEGDSPGDPTVDRHIYARMWWPEAAYVPLVVRKY